MSNYTTIRGLTAREPVGAVLRIGRKHPQKGYPIERDRFYIASKYENDKGIRPLLPDFAAFNDLSARTPINFFRCNLIHAAADDAFVYHLSARVLGPSWKEWPKAHPNMRPVCEGDGEKATRLYGIGQDGEEDWQEIECPNDLCEFRQSKACKPWGKLYFQPRWREGWADRLPSPEMVFTTGSWNTLANFKGLFEQVGTLAGELGVDSPSLTGLPVILHLGEKKDKAKGHVFPVVSASVDGNLAEFLLMQKERRERLSSGGGAVAALTDGGDDTEGESVEVDCEDITPPSVPGQPALFEGNG